MNMTRTRTRIETRWVGMGLGALGGCGPGGVDSLEGFGSLGDDADAEASSDVSETEGSFEGPFEIVAAELEGDTALLLTFTHPLGPVAGVEPSDFRISWVFSTHYVNYYGSGYYDGTQYFDPNSFEYSNTLRVIALENVSDLTMRLEFEDPLISEACEYIAYWAETPPAPPSARINGLFLHHRAGASPVANAQATPLASFGATWVDYPSVYMHAYTFGMPELDPRIEIPCP